jgi:hypothetical protein
VGYLKQLMLEKPKPVELERTYEFGRPASAADLRALVEGFDASSIGGLAGTFTLIEEDGRFTCTRLPELIEQLGRRRVSRFDVRLRSFMRLYQLNVRSDGARSACTRRVPAKKRRQRYGRTPPRSLD